MQEPVIVDLGWRQMAAAYVYVIIPFILLRKRRINKQWELVLASMRMTGQLVLAGYVLTYIFGRPHVAVTLLVFAGMEWFAVRNIYARIGRELSGRLRKVIALSMLIGSAASLMFFLLVVVGVDPWYTPAYFIPIGGMIIGNSMTGVVIGAERLVSGMHSYARQIEGAMMLGARPGKAAQTVVNEAFSAAIIPTINSMMGIGIVFLPGMMTGQILAGAPPVTAIQYQIAIMLGILGSVSLTVYLMIEFGYRTFFNERQQLKLQP